MTGNLSIWKTTFSIHHETWANTIAKKKTKKINTQQNTNHLYKTSHV